MLEHIPQMHLSSDSFGRYQIVALGHVAGLVDFPRQMWNLLVKCDTVLLANHILNLLCRLSPAILLRESIGTWEL
jgi:hypothetical protein